jgi:hypothetical protein
MLLQSPDYRSCKVIEGGGPFMLNNGYRLPRYLCSPHHASSFILEGTFLRMSTESQSIQRASVVFLPFLLL